MDQGRQLAAACQAKSGGPRTRSALSPMPSRIAAVAGRSTSSKFVSVSWSMTRLSSVSGGAMALHKLQYSQAGVGADAGLTGV